LTAASSAFRISAVVGQQMSWYFPSPPLLLGMATNFPFSLFMTRIPLTAKQPPIVALAKASRFPDSFCTG
jgi:hypothetical protein